MAGVPVVFRDQKEKTIASYNYTDIASGTGIATYYLANLEDDSGVELFMTSKEIYSKDTAIAMTASGGVVTHTKTFDLSSFNRPINFRGTAIINLPWLYNESGSIASWVTAKLFHWDGSTETSIGTQQSYNFGGIGNGEVGVLCFKIPINSVVHFKKGEILRFKWEVYQDAGGGSTTMRIAIDPKGRTFETVPTSVSSIQMPVMLDL